MAAQELLEGAGQLARRVRISGLVALCAVELCFLWVSVWRDRRCADKTFGVLVLREVDCSLTCVRMAPGGNGFHQAESQLANQYLG